MLKGLVSKSDFLIKRIRYSSSGTYRCPGARSSYKAAMSQLEIKSISLGRIGARSAPSSKPHCLDRRPQVDPRPPAPDVRLPVGLGLNRSQALPHRLDIYRQPGGAMLRLDLPLHLRIDVHRKQDGPAGRGSGHGRGGGPPRLGTLSVEEHKRKRTRQSASLGAQQERTQPSAAFLSTPRRGARRDGAPPGSCADM